MSTERQHLWRVFSHRDLTPQKTSDQWSIAGDQCLSRFSDMCRPKKHYFPNSAARRDVRDMEGYVPESPFAPKFWTKQSQNHHRWMDTMASQMLNRSNDVQTKQGDRFSCCRGDFKSHLVCTPRQPQSWHRYIAGDEGFLRLGSHFRGLHSSGCSEKHCGAVSTNPVPACSSIP